MDYITYYRSVDLSKNTTAFHINAKQNDTLTRRLVLNFTDRGRPFCITEYDTATIYALKPDGTSVYDRCVIDEETIIYLSLIHI